MVAIDSSHDIPAAARRTDSPHAGQVSLFALLISALVAAASLNLAVDGTSPWGLAADMVGRFSLFLFVAAMVVEPIARLIPSDTTEAAARERPSLMLGFAFATAMSLGCLMAPVYLGTEKLAGPVTVYSAMTAAIVVVLLISSHPATERFMGERAWRTLQRIATAYFWLAFSLIGIDKMVGPHRPDSWHGISLLLLVGALLIRFTDTFVAHVRRPRATTQGMAVKVG
jgi:hypothetical protein